MERHPHKTPGFARLFLGRPGPKRADSLKFSLLAGMSRGDGLAADCVHRHSVFSGAAQSGQLYVGAILAGKCGGLGGKGTYGESWTREPGSFTFGVLRAT